jgi:hypothetical protein
MSRPHFGTSRQFADPTELSFDEWALGGSSRDSLSGARIDSAWILRKFDTEFNDEVMQNLKKAVYAIGQGGRRWFSGGSELSGRQASTILDYLVLVELLIQCREDLFDYRGDLFDCRDQLLMQVTRFAEGQGDRVTSLVDSMVQQLQQQVAGL